MDFFHLEDCQWYVILAKLWDGKTRGRWKRRGSDVGRGKKGGRGE